MVFDRTRELEYIAQYMAKDVQKIISIDLKEDTFDLVKIDRVEMDEGHGYNKKLSYWFEQLGKSGMIHKDDLLRYETFMNLDYIRTYFLQGNKRFTLTYRRMVQNSYQWVTTRIFSTSDYSADNQKAILIVQADDVMENLEIMSMAKMQFEILYAIAGIYVSMHAIKLDDNTYIDLNNATNNNLEFNVKQNATKAIEDIILERINPEYQEIAFEFADLSTIVDRFKDKKVLSIDLYGDEVGWVRLKFMPAQYNEDGTPSLLLFTSESVNEEKRKEQELVAISTELNLACQIQESVLPSVFPAYPNKKEFDIYASMNPAKEVGGDFYDFYFIDEDHFAMVIADVSGKGIPAALFMMVSKAVIKNQANEKLLPSQILKKVNIQLCEDNEMEMFVTVWLGILEISTGKLIACNAGHEYPALREKDGDFKLLRSKHSLPLGCFSNVVFRDYELQLQPSDQLFVYTDGATEATNNENELFGTDRLVDALNVNGQESIDQKLITVKQKIDSFVDGATQFDDITMMIFQYNGMDK